MLIPWWHMWIVTDPFSFLFQTQNVTMVLMKLF